MLNALRRILKLRWLHYAAELALIIILALSFSQVYLDSDPSFHLAGAEAENVTVQAQFLSASMQELGYIPYWQPYSNEGFPGVDDAYSFIVNPFNFIPIILEGGNNGVKIAIVVHFIIAGVGGWFLGYTLNMGFLGRLLLGSLLVLKGNMQSTIGIGFFQLGIAQAYSPWVMAGALAIPRYPNKRYPVVLLALSLALIFYCGTLFYVLPAIMLAGLVCLFYVLRFSRRPFRVRVQWTILWKFILAGAFSLGLVAVIALTVALNFNLLGNHPGEWEFPYSDAVSGLRQFVESEPIFQGLFSEFIYSYLIPYWYLILLFVLLPPVWKLQLSANPRLDRRLWGILLLGFIFFTAWGVSLRPFIPWLYEQISLLAQWRMPQRFLGVASFLLAFLLAFRLDGLHRALMMNVAYTRATGWLTRGLVTGFLFATTWMAVSEVNQRTYQYSQIEQEDLSAEQCVMWLKAAYPDRFISVLRRDFFSTASFIRSGVRLAQIGFDYDLNGVAPSLYQYDLTNIPPELYMPAWDETPDIMAGAGYIPLDGSPPTTPDVATPCAWRNPRGFPYAFSVAMDDLLVAPETFPAEITTPVIYQRPFPEYIVIQAMPDPVEQTVIVAQDVAYPGWQVRLNGQPAQLESVGYLLGVTIPPGSEPQIVEFIYTAPTLKIGGAITITTIVLCMLYLLRVDQLPRRLNTALHSGSVREVRMYLSVVPRGEPELAVHTPHEWVYVMPLWIPGFITVLFAVVFMPIAYLLRRFKPVPAADQASALPAFPDADPPAPAPQEEA